MNYNIIAAVLSMVARFIRESLKTIIQPQNLKLK